MNTVHTRRCAALLMAALLLTANHPTEAQETARRPITLEDLWKVQRLGKPALSPDGRWAAAEVTRYTMADNSSRSDLWLFSTDGKVARQLTTFKGTNGGPAWSPDGTRLAFISKRTGDVPQIHVIAPDGGEARQVSHLPMAPAGLKWGADGKTIFCVVHTWPDTPDDESYRKRERERKADKVQAYIIEDALYRVWDKWIADGKRPVVFAVDVATGKHRNLFAGTKAFLTVADASAGSYDVSPDGKELCYVSDSAKDLGLDFNLDLYVMPLVATGKSASRNLTAENGAGDFSPVYAPDGKSIAFLRQTTKFFYADRARLMLHDRRTGTNREITANFDRTCSNPQWAPDAARLFFEAEDKGYHRLFTVSAEGNDVAPLTGGHTDQSLSLSKDGRRLAFLRSSFGVPGTLQTLPVGGKRTEALGPTRLDRFNDELRAAWDLGAVKEVYFKGADDAPVQMWVVYPPKFDPAKKWPLLHVVHGGPHNGITTDFHYRWNLHLLASKGYVVACVNFHGSSGFGQKFTDSITGDLATKPTIDILRATDYLVKEPYIDPDRIAAAGASYGGYMMAWLNGHTDRFKAMVCHAGVYNWHSMAASDYVRSRERPLGAKPWGDQEKIDRQSAERYAANFKTPTLVMHGEKDYRVPVTQGFEYYNTLRLKGVPTRLVYFPDENHWITKPQNARLWHREVFAWLDRFVGHGPTKE
jgi:dipeptidyl aminopeptidase/acylaminoacyl peptidase